MLWKFEEITYMDIIKLGLQVMDTTAVSLCKDNNLPMIIFLHARARKHPPRHRRQKLGSLVTA